VGAGHRVVRTVREIERQRVTEPEQEAIRRLLRALEQDARLSHAMLATISGFSEEKVGVLLDELHEAGVIRRYKTIVNWEKIAVERVTAYIDVGVSPQRNVGFDDVAARIYRFPEVRGVYLVSGSSDLRVIVDGDSIRQIAAFVSEKLAPIEHVTSTNTHFLLKSYKEDGEILVESPSPEQRIAVAPSKNPEGTAGLSRRGNRVVRSHRILRVVYLAHVREPEWRRSVGCLTHWR
jgi:DNA-binding Lrp family transcriptional regulator